MIFITFMETILGCSLQQISTYWCRHRKACEELGALWIQMSKILEIKLERSATLEKYWLLF